MTRTRIARTWAGSVNGFTVPTGENFYLIMSSWLQSQEFWRLQQLYRASPGSLAFLLDGPPPGFLLQQGDSDHAAVPRTLSTAPAREGGARREPWGKGDTGHPRGHQPDVSGRRGSGKLAVSTTAVLFGGAYKANKGSGDALHACPGKEMAWGVIMGLAAAVFEQNNIMSEGLLSVSMD